MWARVVGDLKSDTEFVFHCPVGANPLCFTYVLCNGKQPVPGRTDMYNYYKIENLSGPCPVYLCVGSNEDLTAFAADVEALGLETTIVRALPGENVCFAVDPLENRIHEVSLAAAIDLIINEGAIPSKFWTPKRMAPSLLSGPSPSLPFGRCMAVFGPLPRPWPRLWTRSSKLRACPRSRPIWMNPRRLITNPGWRCPDV